MPQLDRVLQVRDVYFQEGLDIKPINPKEPKYNAIFEDVILVETLTTQAKVAAIQPLIPSIQEEEHAYITEQRSQRQRNVSFNPIITIIEEPKELAAKTVILEKLPTI